MIILTKLKNLAIIKTKLFKYIEGSKLAIKNLRILDISVLIVFAAFAGWLIGSVWSAHLKNDELMRKLEYIQSGKLKTEKDRELLAAELEATNDPIYVERILREQRKIPQGELLLIDNK